MKDINFESYPVDSNVVIRDLADEINLHGTVHNIQTHHLVVRSDGGACIKFRKDGTSVGNGFRFEGALDFFLTSRVRSYEHQTEYFTEMATKQIANAYDSAESQLQRAIEEVRRQKERAMEVWEHEQKDSEGNSLAPIQDHLKWAVHALQQTHVDFGRFMDAVEHIRQHEKIKVDNKATLDALNNGDINA
jgi:hypothetical protein